MDTILVICYNLEDFYRWLVNEKGFDIIPNRRTNTFVHDNERYVAVRKTEHLRGYMPIRVEHTDTAVHFNDDFFYLMSIAELHLKPKKEFKFGR